MRRGSNSNYEPNVKPVQSIELSDKHLGLRIAAFAVFIVIGIGALTYGFVSFMNGGTGWRTVETGNIRGYSYSDEIIFQYNVKSTTEYKKLVALYKSLLERICPLFEADIEYEGINNIYYINHHINEQIVVDELLYDAFIKIAENDFRTIYTAPFYEEYKDLFFCMDDYDAANFDPDKNEYTAERAQKISVFANDKNSVDLKLLGNNTVMLYVSDEYRKYAEEIGAGSYIDLWLIKNAFITDYCADTIIKAGYERGRINTYDGYLRNFDKDTEYGYTIFELDNGTARAVTYFTYSGNIASFNLRAFSKNSLDGSRVFEYSDGTVKTSFLDPADCRDKAFCSSLDVYSYKSTCTEIAFDAINAYITSPDKIEWKDGVYYVYSKDFTVYHSEKGLTFVSALNTPVYTGK